MTIVWPVMVSVRHRVTTMSAQSSSSVGFFRSDVVRCPLAFRGGPRATLLWGLSSAGRRQRTGYGRLRPARLGHFVHVPVGAAAGQVAVRVLHHPTRKVWSEVGLSHPSNSPLIA